MQAFLNHPNFTLNVSGIVGFLGGEEAISAMESVHFYKFKRFLGWYNSPGSYNIAKHYGKLARSPVWDGLYPGMNEEPANFLGMDGKRGPKYKGIVSGTTIDDIGHVGYIFAQYCRGVKASVTITGDLYRKTKPMTVTVVEFTGESGKDTDISVEHPGSVSSSPWAYTLTTATILFNLGSCAACGAFREWFAFSLILLGILCNGAACYAIGSAEMRFIRPKPSSYSPPGDGILDDVHGDQFIVLKGSEESVNYVVKGRFRIKYGESTTYHKIGFSALALTCQSLAQLFVIPQSGLFGQILFLATLGVSWFNNAFLSSIDKEHLQTEILKKIFPTISMEKYKLPTRTSAVVFATLCARPEKYLDGLTAEQKAKYVRGILTMLLPMDTDVWDQWRELIVKAIAANDFTNIGREWGEGLLGDLLGDARVAHDEHTQLSTPNPYITVNGDAERV